MCVGQQLSLEFRKDLSLQSVLDKAIWPKVVARTPLPSVAYIGLRLLRRSMELGVENVPATQTVGVGVESKSIRVLPSREATCRRIRCSAEGNPSPLSHPSNGRACSAKSSQGWLGPKKPASIAGNHCLLACELQSNKVCLDMVICQGTVLKSRSWGRSTVM